MFRETHKTLKLASQQQRRGNSIVLVSALLVLLVIIAAAYVTRTNASRGTAQAIRTAELRDAKAHVVRDLVAQHVADALFVAPVQPVYRDAVNNGPTDPPDFPADSNAPRLDITQYDAHFQTFAPTGRYNVDLDYPYNHAPHHVVPFTNWPDALTLQLRLGGNFDATRWPAGPGHPGGGTTGALAHEGNPIGNPGFADLRWLRDPEPVRVQFDFDGNGVITANETVFSHFRHLSYLATPSNGFRVCRDISNVTDFNDVDGDGNVREPLVVEDLNIPIEQWLATPKPTLNTSSGDTAFSVSPIHDLNDNWFSWTNSLLDYQNRHTDPALVPGNFYRLRDLDADGAWPEPGHTPESEFVPETTRNWVSRFLTDTDGDGYTDAFWHLLPLPVQDGIRYIGAFSIIDNSANVNANVATRFQLWDDFNFIDGGNPGFNSRTKSHTPADIALVSQLAPVMTWANWNVGFYDSPGNDNFGPDFAFGAKRFDYDVGNWARHYQRVGLPNGSLNQVQRLDYYRRSGLNPLNPLNPTAAGASAAYYQSFSIADELELRMFHGNNNEWTYSDYETSVQDANNNPQTSFVRAGFGGDESVEIAGQVTNRTLVKDPRHRITLYSNNRNELLPPWLQYRWTQFDSTNADPITGNLVRESLPTEVQVDIDNGVPTGDYSFQQIFSNFNQQHKHKLDLREPNVVANDVSNWVQFNPGWDLAAGVANTGPGLMTFRERLPIALMHAMDDGPRFDPISSTFEGKTYFGEYSFPIVGGAPGTPDEFDPDSTNAFERTRAAATSLAANMLAYRSSATNLSLKDDPNTPRVEGPVGMPDVPDRPATEETQFLGMEMQPFIVEVFFGHVYEAVEVPDTDANGVEYTNAGNHVVLHTSERHTPIIVIQIANPYDRPILLWDGAQAVFTDRSQYEIEMFGETFDFNSDSIMPAPGQPAPTPTDRIFLPPGTPERPSTAILFAMPEGDATNMDLWRDFLDIEHDWLPDDTILWDISGVLPENRDEYENLAPDDQVVALYRRVFDPTGVTTPVSVLIDRIDHPDGSSSESYKDEVESLERPVDMVAPSDDPADYPDATPPASPYQESPEWDMGPNHTHWVQWVRTTRAWGVDLDANGFYEQDERNPRYVFGHKAVITPQQSTYETIDTNFPADDSYWDAHPGNRFNPEPGVDPDNIDGAGTPWFRRDFQSPYYNTANATALRTGKPTFFTMRNEILDPTNPANLAFAPTPNDPADTPSAPPGVMPDKGWYGQRASTGGALAGVDDEVVEGAGSLPHVIHNFAMQMLQKDGDFEQVGEVLNVWMWGHQLTMNPNVPNDPTDDTYEGTRRTFAEFMAEELDDAPNDPVRRAKVNRLTFGEETLGSLDDPANPDFASVQNATPNLPAGLRVLDLFVCDSFGSNWLDYNNDGIVNQLDFDYANANLRFNNANGFSGKPVYGQVNLNTSSPEVMQAMPHMFRVVHGAVGNTSRSFLPEAIAQYRERLNGAAGLTYGYKNIIDTNEDGIPDGFDDGPDYTDRDVLVPSDDMRSERGLASPAEILLMDIPGNAAASVDGNRWRAGFAAMNPYARVASLNRTTARVSTDTVEDFRYDITGIQPDRTWDKTAGDAEELNLLYSGISNMVTTRSDTFTVYMRIRAFKQNPVSGRWDATDPEYIVDDSRYVMLIDRSNVNRPGDKPEILYFEKLPK